MMRGLLATGVLFLMISTAGFAQGFTAGDQTFTISGSGSSDKDVVNTNFSISAAYGYFFDDNWEFSIRDNLDYVDKQGSTSNDDYINTLRAGLNWNWNTAGAWVPYIGGNVGYTCGQLVDDTCLYGAVGGVRWFVNETTYINFSVDYVCYFDDSGGDKQYDDGQLLYNLGVGFKF